MTISTDLQEIKPISPSTKISLSPVGHARLTGVLYLLLGVFSGFAFFSVRNELIIWGDAAATANSILASESLFRIGFVSDLIGQVIFIFLIVNLYKLLAMVSRSQARLMVILALAGVPIAMLNVTNHYAPLLLLSGADYLAVFSTEQLHAFALFFLELLDIGVLVATIFWGLWLLPFGYLVFKSGFIPKILGILLIIGGIGYLVDFFTLALLPSLGGLTIAEYTFIGELLLPLWLLIKGINVEKWQQLAHKHA